VSYDEEYNFGQFGGCCDLRNRFGQRPVRPPTDQHIEEERLDVVVESLVVQKELRWPLGWASVETQDARQQQVLEGYGSGSWEDKIIG